MDDTLTRKDGNHIFPHRGSEVFQVDFFYFHVTLLLHFFDPDLGVSITEALGIDSIVMKIKVITNRLISILL